MYYSVEDSPRYYFRKGKGDEIKDSKSMKAVGRIIESSHGTLIVYCIGIYYCCAYCSGSVLMLVGKHF